MSSLSADSRSVEYESEQEIQRHGPAACGQGSCVALRYAEDLVQTENEH